MLLTFLTQKPTTFHQRDSWGLYNQALKGCNTNHGITALENFEHKHINFYCLFGIEISLGLINQLRARSKGGVG